MAGKRKKNVNWKIHANPDGTHSVDAAQLAVLMDIRDELQELNATLNCHRLQGMPSTLDRIDRRLLRNGLRLRKGKTDE